MLTFVEVFENFVYFWLYLVIFLYSVQSTIYITVFFVFIEIIVQHASTKIVRAQYSLIDISLFASPLQPSLLNFIVILISAAIE